MNIGYFADGPWSHRVLEKIEVDENFKIGFIVPRFDQQDPVLRQWAEKLKVDFLTFRDINHQDFISQIKTYDADLFVSMSFNQIFKKQILSIARLFGSKY